MVGRFAQIPSLKFNVSKSNTSGFVLAEILLVISIVAILATIVLMAINPAARMVTCVFQVKYFTLFNDFFIRININF